MRRGAKALRDWTNIGPPLKRITSKGKLVEADAGSGKEAPSSETKESSGNAAVTKSPAKKGHRKLASEMVSLQNGNTLEVFADGRKVTRCQDGTVIESFPDASKVQTSPEGMRIEVFANGSRRQTNLDGTVLEVDAEGKLTRQIKDGIVVEVHSDGSRTQTNLDGVKITVTLDGTRQQVFPDGTSIVVKPDGSKLQTNPDGTTIKVTPDGVIQQQKPAPSAGMSTTTPARTVSNEASKVPMKAAPQVPGELLQENNKLRDTLRIVEQKAEEDLAALRKKHQEDIQKLIEELSDASERAKNSDDLESALLRANQELEQTKKDLNSVVSANTEELAELKLRLAKTQRDGQDLSAEYDKRLEKETESLRAQIRDLEEVNKKSVAQLQSGGNSGGAEVAEMSSKLAKAETRIRELEARLDDNNQKLERKEAEVKDLSSSSDTLKNQIESLRNALQMAEKEQDALHAQVEDLIFKGGSCAEQLSDLQKERDQAVKERETSYEKLAELTKKMVETVTALADRENSLADAYTELRQLKEDRNPAEINDALKVERDRAHDLETRLKDLSEKTAHADPEMESKLRDAERTLEVQQRVIAGLEKRVETFDEAFSKAKEMNASSLENLRQRLQDAELHLNEVQSELDVANEERDILHAKLDSAQSPSARGDGAAATKEIEQLRVKLLQKDRQITEQKSLIEKLEKVQEFPSVVQPMNALSTEEQPAGGFRPPRPPLNALLGEIQAGAQLKKVSHPAMGGLLAEIQVGPNLRKAAAPEANGASRSPSKPGKPAMPSFAELCQLKAKQRQDKSQKIDEILAKKKEGKTAAASSNVNPELQRALAKRKEQVK